MYCSECGEKNDKDAKECKNCGKPLAFDLKENLKEGTKYVKEKFKNLSNKDGKTYFNQKKYLNYCAVFQVWVWLIYIFIVGMAILASLGMIFATISYGDGTLEAIFVSIFIIGGAYIAAWFITLFVKIRIQNMRWKVDIHNVLYDIVKNTKGTK